jgi:NMD protein affecting ribosome stability and mRNA decay
MVIKQTKMRHYADYLELAVARNLTRLNIDFVHESENKEQGLDFYLPKQDVYIELKQFHSDRINEQLKSRDNVIVLQGRKAIHFFNSITR